MGLTQSELPERIRWELNHFRAAELDVRSALRNGDWCLTFERFFEGQAEEFNLWLGSTYPNIPPRLFGPPGLLERHQSPTTGHLCLVDDDESWWRPWFRAFELVERLDVLLEAAQRGTNEVRDLEAPIPEPVTGYLSFRSDRTILVPSAMLADDLGATAGLFTLRRVNARVSVLSTLSDGAGTDLAAAESEVLALARDKGGVGGWVSLDTAPPVKHLVPALIEGSGRAFAQRRPTSRRARRRQKSEKACVTGVTFFEEGPRQGERRRTWVFAETRAGAGAEAEFEWLEGRPIRGLAVSAAQRQDRIPELEGLQHGTALVIGAGSVGSAVAIELAKAGIGRLLIYDPDIYEPGNSVRHVLGVSHAGEPKASAVAAVARKMNPFCVAEGHKAPFGTGENEDLDVILVGCDVVIDSTGSHSVTRMLTTQARPHGVPVVSAALTAGGFGGRVVVFRPDGPCWDCFSIARDAELVPMPDEGPKDAATPFGCSHPAASCAGFDVSHLASVAARIAVQATELTKYPPLQDDWVVLNFRPGAIPVQQGQLSVHSECPLPLH